MVAELTLVAALCGGAARRPWTGVFNETAARCRLCQTIIDEATRAARLAGHCQIGRSRWTLMLGTSLAADADNPGGGIICRHFPPKPSGPVPPCVGACPPAKPPRGCRVLTVTSPPVENDQVVQVTGTAQPRHGRTLVFGLTRRPLR